MKRLKTPGKQCQFRLTPAEAAQLRHLLAGFPFTALVPAKISKTDSRDESWEREELLQESLAEHRTELRRQAQQLMDAEHLREQKTGWRLSLLPAEREILLQILNDIRVGCWHLLGKPDELYSLNSVKSARDHACLALMHLAGYFEHHLVDATTEAV